MSDGRLEAGRLTHVRADGSAHMVDVSAKPETAPALYIDCGTSDGLLASYREIVAILQ